MSQILLLSLILNLYLLHAGRGVPGLDADVHVDQLLTAVLLQLIQLQPKYLMTSADFNLYEVTKQSELNTFDKFHGHSFSDVLPTKL